MASVDDEAETGWTWARTLDSELVKMIKVDWIGIGIIFANLWRWEFCGTTVLLGKRVVLRKGAGRPPR